MKRTLEAVLVLAALALGAYVVRTALARRELAAHPPVMNPASGPGEDAAQPGVPEARARRGVQGLPMVKMSRPPKPDRRPAVVPPPSASTP